MFGKAISNLMIKPGLAPVFDSPENHGLEYEDVTFKAEDGVTLSGWLIKGGTDKVIVQSHFGVQCSRCGFTLEGKGAMERLLWNTDIHFLNQAKNQLLNSNDKVGQIAYSLGFEYPQHFSRVFKAKTGMSPGQFRKVG